MISIPEVDEYLTYMHDHKARVNEYRFLLEKNIIRPTLERDDITFDRETYDKCLKYCEINYYKLLPYQKMIYAMCFLYDSNRSPVFSKIIVVMGRGNGKDGFIMPLANFFQTPLYGQKNYHIDIVANDEKQAHDTFDVAYEALTEKDKVKPKFAGKFKVTKTEIKNLKTKSRIRYNTSNPKTKDGKKIGCLILNEIHAYEDYSQINVFESAFGKIANRREFIITTAGYVRGGPYDDYMSICANILQSGENDLKYFPFICKLENESEISDFENLYKANPSMEYFPNLRDEVHQAWLERSIFPSKMPEFLTKRCNLPAQRVENAVTSWTNILRCSYIGDTDRELERRNVRRPPDTRGQVAVIGIDYADIKDFASCGILTMSNDDEYVWTQRTWINRRNPFFDQIKFPFQNAGQPGYEDFKVIDAPVIPIDEICAYVDELCAMYDVRKIAMDTYRYSLFKSALESFGYSEETRQNPYGTVRLVRKITSATGIVAPMIEKAFEEGKIIYGDSAIMRWYTNNTSIETDKYGNKQFCKIEPKLRKNDGFMAFDVAMFCKDELKEAIVYV